MEGENPQNRPAPKRENSFLSRLFTRKKENKSMPDLRQSSNSSGEPQPVTAASIPGRSAESLHDRLLEEQKKLFIEESQGTEKMLNEVFNRELYRKEEVDEEGYPVTRVAYINDGATGKERNNRIMIKDLDSEGKVKGFSITYKETDPKRFSEILGNTKKEDRPTT